MFKKLIALLFIATATTSSFAYIGPYLGGDLGITNNTSSRSSFRGLTASVLGGFGGAINEDVYLAGELFADLGSLVIDNNTGCGSDIRTTYGYGISIIPGLLLSNRTMAYFRLGLLKARFTNLGSTVTGGQLGLGMQTSITQSWDLRGEYDYVAYQKTSGVSPSSDQFKLGLIYKFG